MNQIKYLFPCLFLSLFYVSESIAENSGGSSIHYIIGFKDMENQYWPPYGEQYELGVEYILRKEEYPLAIVFGFSFAEAEFNYFGKEKSSSKEFNLGLRHEFIIWDKTLSFLEAGASYIKGKVELQGKDINPDNIFNESAFGTWVAAGNTWVSENNTELGFKLKMSNAKTHIPSGEKVNLGGVHYIFFTGFHFQ